MTELITVAELAKMMKISPRTVYRMLAAGQIPSAIKFGGSWRFSVDKINKQWKNSDKR